MKFHALDLTFTIGVNYRKREEENKRKEANLQKGMQNLQLNCVQQQLANREKSYTSAQLFSKPADVHNKRPFSCSMSQDQAGRSNRGSPTGSQNKATLKEKFPPAELLGEDRKFKKGL